MSLLPLVSLVFDLSQHRPVYSADLADNRARTPAGESMQGHGTGEAMTMRDFPFLRTQTVAPGGGAGKIRVDGQRG